jgi:hypothetical protein
LPHADSGDAGTKLLDDRGTLVAQHDGPGALPVSVAYMEVRVAHAGRQHPDPDLAGARGVEGQLLDDERRSRTVDDGGAQIALTPWMRFARS